MLLPYYNKKLYKQWWIKIIKKNWISKANAPLINGLLATIVYFTSEIVIMKNLKIWSQSQSANLRSRVWFLGCNYEKDSPQESHANQSFNSSTLSLMWQGMDPLGAPQHVVLFLLTLQLHTVSSICNFSFFGCQVEEFCEAKLKKK